MPNYIELLQGDPDQVALALNVTELEGDRDIPSDQRSGHQLFLLGVGADWLIGG